MNFPGKEPPAPRIRRDACIIHYLDVFIFPSFSGVSNKTALPLRPCRCSWQQDGTRLAFLESLSPCTPLPDKWSEWQVRVRETDGAAWTRQASLSRDPKCGPKTKVKTIFQYWKSFEIFCRWNNLYKSILCLSGFEFLPHPCETRSKVQRLFV